MTPYNSQDEPDLTAPDMTVHPAPPRPTTAPSLPAVPVSSAELTDRPDLSKYAMLGKHWNIAGRLAERYYGRLLYVHGIGWHTWDGKRWEVDPGDVRVARMVAETLRHAWEEVGRTSGESRKDMIRNIQSAETAGGTAGALQLARSVEGMGVTVDKIDADPWLLNTATGTVDLRTMRIRPAAPEDRITRVTRGGYSPGSPAAAPRWTAFLARVLPDPEIRAFLARVYGYGLLGIVREHVMPIFTGTGQNGKSTLIKAVGGALGDYYAAVKPELLLAGRKQSGSSANPDVMALMGRRVVSMVETAADARLDTAMVKNLTGGDVITARPLYRDIVQFVPTHLPIMATNHLPEVPADDPALWRRLAVVPFDVVIPDAERDETLAEALDQEADGILAWALAGWEEYHKRHRLDLPEAVQVRTDQYREQSDIVLLWVADCCNVDGWNTHVRTSVTSLWDSWENWARNNRRPAGRKPDLTAALMRIPGVADKRTNQGRFLSGISLMTT